MKTFCICNLSLHLHNFLCDLFAVLLGSQKKKLMNTFTSRCIIDIICNCVTENQLFLVSCPWPPVEQEQGHHRKCEQGLIT